MEKRSDSTGSLVDASVVEEHFNSGPKAVWRVPHSGPSGWSLCGVKKACSPGVTRDVKGGMDW